jgi:hypothetical protein
VRRADGPHCDRHAIRKLLFAQLLGHMRVPFAGYRPHHRAGVELATIEAHRAAEAAADLERRLDDGVAREARRDRFEIRDFAGRAAAVPFFRSTRRWAAASYRRRGVVWSRPSWFCRSVIFGSRGR